jgi:hypothetical protein
MKSGNMFWGVLLVVLGGLILLDNLGIVCLSLGDIWKFWPVLLVFLGIAALVKNQKARWIASALVAAFLALIVFSLFTFRWSGCEWDGGSRAVETQNLSEPYSPGIDEASLEIEAGAASVAIEGTTGQLVEAETRSSLGQCTLTSSGSEHSRRIVLKVPGDRSHFRFGRLKNEASIRLHEGPVWDLSLGVGATSANLDLRPFSVKSVGVHAGATTVKVSLGMPKDETEVNIEAGASSITVEVPREASCEISVDAPLSSKSFEGFEKIRSGRYRSENFSEGGRLIRIRIEAGVSKVRVRRV